MVLRQGAGHGRPEASRRQPDFQAIQAHVPQVERCAEKAVQPTAGAESTDADERWNIGATVVPQAEIRAGHVRRREYANIERSELDLAGKAFIEGVDHTIADVRRRMDHPRQAADHGYREQGDQREPPHSSRHER